MPKILVLDDQPAIVELIRLELERHGFEVYSAIDGIEGFELALKIKPDLLILDVLMPRLDGFHFYKKMKEDPGLAATPVLIMTARGGMRDTFEGLGAESFLAKPFELEQLLSQVNRFFPQAKEAKTILVIDDEYATAELMKLNLERSGFKAKIASDGLEGLELALKIKPDLIILDLLMPRLDGFQFYKKKNEMMELAHIPLLIVTAREAMKDVFKDLPEESFLVKPFNPDVLIGRVGALLSGAPKAQRAGKQETGKKALIAGTDAKRLAMMREQLEAKGYKVETASDGPQALGKALQLLPDLFVVQSDMPQMDAQQIIKVLDEHPGAKKVSVVVYSLLDIAPATGHSLWSQYVGAEPKKPLRAQEGPLKVIDKLDARSFLDKIKDFL